MSVCVCVCMCVFILLHRGSFFRLQDLCDILDGYGSAMSCCEYYSRCFCQVTSFPFLNMSYFTSEGEAPARRKLTRKRYDIRFREKMIYIDKGYKSAHHQTHKWQNDTTKDKEATLIYILPLWIKSLALA